MGYETKEMRNRWHFKSITATILKELGRWECRTKICQIEITPSKKGWGGELYEHYTTKATLLPPT
jgi:hypothetical protein